MPSRLYKGPSDSVKLRQEANSFAGVARPAPVPDCPGLSEFLQQIEVELALERDYELRQSPMVSPRRRASAFGTFTASYGIFWFLGSAVIGILYDVSVPAVIVFCVVTQLAAVPVFIWIARRSLVQYRA